MSATRIRTDCVALDTCLRPFPLNSFKFAILKSGTFAAPVILLIDWRGISWAVRNRRYHPSRADFGVEHREQICTIEGDEGSREREKREREKRKKRRSVHLGRKGNLFLTIHTTCHTQPYTDAWNTKQRHSGARRLCVTFVRKGEKEEKLHSSWAQVMLLNE